MRFLGWGFVCGLDGWGFGGFVIAGFTCGWELGAVHGVCVLVFLRFLLGFDAGCGVFGLCVYFVPGGVFLVLGFVLLC